MGVFQNIDKAAIEKSVGAKKKKKQTLTKTEEGRTEETNDLVPWQ